MDDVSPRPDHDPLRRWPSPAYNPGSFEGQLQQVDKLAAGMRSPRSGWRRPVGRIGLGAVLVIAVVIAVLAYLGGR